MKFPYNYQPLFAWIIIFIEYWFLPNRCTSEALKFEPFAIARHDGSWLSQRKNDFCSISKVAPVQFEQELMFCCGAEIVPKNVLVKQPIKMVIVMVKHFFDRKK